MWGGGNVLVLYYWVQCYFPRKVRLKITQSKIALLRVKLYFPRKRKNKIYPVKTSVNTTQGTMLFSKERVRLKITQSKLPLTVRRVQ